MTDAKPPERAGAADDERGLERLVFFSDAVIAIAITLLAIEIHLPEVHSGTEIPAALFSLWPQYLGYVISFLVVGSFWYGHHRMFRLVVRYDDVVLWLNLVFLLCIAFIPFASSVLGEYSGEPSAVFFYSIVMIATGAAEMVLWVYVSYDHRLLDPELSDRRVTMGTLRNLTPPAVFILALPLIVVSPYLAMTAWIAIYVILIILVRAENTPSEIAVR